MRAPRALLWDVGNVIVGWSPRRLYEELFEEPAACDRFLSSVCTLDWHLEHDRGVSFADNAAALAGSAHVVRLDSLSLFASGSARLKPGSTTSPPSSCRVP